MTIKEMIGQLNSLVSQGIDPNTYVVIGSEEFDSDSDVNCIYYDVKTERIYIGIW